MKNMHIRSLALLAGLWTAQVLALPQAVVDTVQMPAWLDRGGATRPLVPGTELQNGDKLRTGAAGRAYLRLADGSMVKLGQAAHLGFYSRSLRPERHFKGALDVLSGAFRFTTGAVQRLGGQRELDIRVGAVTAGIRGTDLWGKSDAERDLVCLIEGHIALKHAGSALEMDEALSYFAAPKRGAAGALARVDAQQLARWARETEVLPGDGASQRGGMWQVLLGVSEEEGQALALYDRARDAGYGAQIHPRAVAGGKWRYEVIVAQLRSELEAEALAKRLGAELELAASVRR